MRSLFRHLIGSVENRQHTHLIDSVAGVNSGISAVALLPQLFIVLQSRTADGLSPLAFFLIALNSFVWFLYGMHRQMLPLIISSSLNTLASIGILIAISVRG